jgi:hypothetical protein
VRALSIAVFYFFVAGFAHADAIDSLALLKRDLGQSIEVVSKHEIRYCPDNTCEIIKSQKPTNLLPAFLYLYLFHESGYVELGKSFNDQKPFREAAAEEPQVRKSVERFCPSAEKTPKCILQGMRSNLGIKSCFGRYDEGYFCYGCSENENICKKL